MLFWIIAAIVCVAMMGCCAVVLRGYERNVPLLYMTAADREEYAALKSMYPLPRARCDCSESIFGASAGYGCDESSSRE